MIYSKDKNFLFIHIPKTAGTTLRKALAPYQSGRRPRLGLIKSRLQRYGFYQLNFAMMKIFGPFKHITARQARRLMGKKKFEAAYKFAIIRRPEDWVVSSWRFAARRPRHIFHSQAKSCKNLMEWIDVIEHSYRREIAAFGGIQASYIYDESGTLLVDKILQLETLTQDIAAIAKVINAPITLEYENVSTNLDKHKFEITPEALHRLRKLLPSDYAFYQ